MKIKPTLWILLMILPSYSLFAQDSNVGRIPLIGERAPSFEAQSTKGKLTFPDDYFGKWKILFSHPGDFTPVCTTEIIEMAGMQDIFEKLNTKIVVLSTDGLQSHIEWIKSMESISYKGKPTVKIDFPFISDGSLEISKKYGMIHPYSNSNRDIRGVFIIDPDNRIQAILFYPMTIGRNLDEIERILIALQTAEKGNTLTPANWIPGEDVLLNSPQTIKEAEKLKASNDSSLYSLIWYLWFKKAK